MERNEVPDLIYDVGAHKGENSDFYLRLGFRVVAVEANPMLVVNNAFVKRLVIPNIYS